jgi:drug/metabolite transporter (DMT)-like permease
MAIASAVVLSTTAIFIRYLSLTFQLPALVLACWRDWIVTACLLPALSLFHPVLLRVNRVTLRYLALYGLVLAVFNSLWTLSVILNGAAVATVLSYSSAAFTVVLAWWLLKEQMTWVKCVAVASSLIGCLLVSGALDPAVWKLHMGGILVGVLAGLLYALYTLMGRSAAQRDLNPWTCMLYSFGTAALLLLAVNLLAGGMVPGAAAQPADLFWLGKSWSGWGILLLLGAGPTLTGYALYNISLGHLPSSVVNLIATSEPVFTTAAAYLVLGERLGAVQILGGLMILAAVVFLRVMEGRTSGTDPKPIGTR